MKNILFLILGFCISMSTLAKPEIYKITGGGGMDDMQLQLQNLQGKKYNAYCNLKCGEWFYQDEDSEYSTLKDQLINKKVLAEIKFEKNNDRVAGPSNDEKFYFIQSLKLLP